MNENDNGHGGCPSRWIARGPVGGVATCGCCGNVHLSLEYLTLRLEPAAFRELVAMLALARARMDAERAPRSAEVDSTPVTDKPLH